MRHSEETVLCVEFSSNSFVFDAFVCAMAEKRPAKSKDKTASGRSKDSPDQTNMHPYARKGDNCLIPLPESEPCTPDSKRSRPEPTLGEVQDNIVKILVEKMSQNTAVLNQEIQQNRECVNSLKEATEFLFQELKDVKAVISYIKTMGEDLQKRITELEDKLNDTERYQRRWNLRLYGLAEQEGEDVKSRVVEICRSVIPENEEACQQHIDVSHRVGRKSVEKIRPVIIRFVARSTRDLIWKNARGSEYLKSRKLRFGEDLTTKDKEARNKLWPQIDAALKEGKRAFYLGTKAIINGKEVRV